MPDCEIAVATSDDVQAIIALQDRNLREQGGALSVRFSQAWFEAAISEMPVIVAREGPAVVGYVVSTPLAAQAHDPIVQAMLRAYSGRSNAYIYGPVCVAETHRGRGLARAMFDELRARLPGREGFTFIRADNALSRTVHARLGLREVAAFTVGETAYVVVAYDG